MQDDQRPPSLGDFIRQVLPTRTDQAERVRPCAERFARLRAEALIQSPPPWVVRGKATLNKADYAFRSCLEGRSVSAVVVVKALYYLGFDQRCDSWREFLRPPDPAPSPIPDSTCRDQPSLTEPAQYPSKASAGSTPLSKGLSKRDGGEDSPPRGRSSQQRPNRSFTRLRFRRIRVAIMLAIVTVAAFLLVPRAHGDESVQDAARGTQLEWALLVDGQGRPMHLTWAKALETVEERGWSLPDVDQAERMLGYAHVIRAETGLVLELPNQPPITLPSRAHFWTGTRSGSRAAAIEWSPAGIGRVRDNFISLSDTANQQQFALMVRRK